MHVHKHSRSLPSINPMGNHDPSANSEHTHIPTKQKAEPLRHVHYAHVSTSFVT